MDRAPINLGGIDIVCVDELQYLGSSIHHCGCPSDDVDARVAAASSASGTFQKPVFSVRYCDIHIEWCVFNACAASGASGTFQKPVFSVRYRDIHIEWCVFNACALSLLIYGSEC